MKPRIRRSKSLIERDDHHHLLSFFLNKDSDFLRDNILLFQYRENIRSQEGKNKECHQTDLRLKFFFTSSSLLRVSSSFFSCDDDRRGWRRERQDTVTLMWRFECKTHGNTFYSLHEYSSSSCHLVLVSCVEVSDIFFLFSCVLQEDLQRKSRKKRRRRRLRR
jgi:hypothetical protein